MAKHMDEHQEKLYDNMERLDGDAFNILHHGDTTNVGDVGRALYHQNLGHGAALRFIESRLRDIHETSESLQTHIFNAVKSTQTMLRVFLWVAIIEGAIIIYLLWPRR